MHKVVLAANKDGKTIAKRTLNFSSDEEEDDYQNNQGQYPTGRPMTDEELNDFLQSEADPEEEEIPDDDSNHGEAEEPKESDIEESDVEIPGTDKKIQISTNHIIVKNEEGVEVRIHKKIVDYILHG